MGLGRGGWAVIAGSCVSMGGCGGQATSDPEGNQGAEKGCVAQVAIDSRTTCALRFDGTLWCWGGPFLGDGTEDSVETPVQVVSLGTSVTEVAGAAFTDMFTESAQMCSRKTDGTLWCWGGFWLGGTLENSDWSPVEVASLGAQVAQVSTSGIHTCAVKTDHTLWCWGDNSAGEIGDGTTEGPKLTPVQVTSLGTEVVQVAAGAYRTCALKVDRTVWCWGFVGVTGSDVTDTGTPVQIASLGSNVAEITSGRNENWVWAVKTDGTLWSGNGELASLGHSVLHVATGGASTCSVKKDGTLWCWKSTEQPSQIASLGSDVADVAVGVGGLCARKTNGTLWCGNWQSGSLELDGIAVPCP